MKAFAIGVKESKEQATSWTGRHGLTYPVIADPQGEIFRYFGAAVPHHILIDSDLHITLSTGEFEKDSLIGAIEGVMKSRERNGRIYSFRE